jgi:RNA polymerase sigma factor (sigma-70 family)
LPASPGTPHPLAGYFSPIFAKCRRLLGDSAAAEDVAQEAIFRLWKSNLAAGADTRTTMAWLYRTCTRLAIDELRRRRAHVGTAADARMEAVPCGVDAAACLEARQLVARLAGSIPADELDAVVLCRVDGLTHPEVAVVLEVSERTVRRLLASFDERTAPLQRELLS